MPDLPAVFVGLWERVALDVDRVVIDDAGRSFWFQGAEAFLDVRAEGGGLPAEAFAGVTMWDPTAETLSWRHDLDLHGAAPDDSGRIEWRGDDLIEHGEALLPEGHVSYTEVWRPRHTAGEAVTIADRVDGRGRLAATGHYVAAMIDDRPGGGVRAAVFREGDALVVIGEMAPGADTTQPNWSSARFDLFGAAWRAIAPDARSS